MEPVATRRRSLLLAPMIAVSMWPFACGDHIPPATANDAPIDTTGAETWSIPGMEDAASAASPADAGGEGGAQFHAMTVSLCARDADACAQAGGSVPPSEPAYRVAFGRGAGIMRTREQAMTDLYREMRDRLGWGAHLVAEPQRLPPADGASGLPASRPPNPSDEDEPLVRTAFDLMDSVDSEGEVTIDTLPALTAGHCKLAVGGVAVDGGRGRCVVAEPVRQSAGRR
jgi:hypothetical protein